MIMLNHRYPRKLPVCLVSLEIPSGKNFKCRKRAITLSGIAGKMVAWRYTSVGHMNVYKLCFGANFCTDLHKKIRQGTEFHKK